MLKEDSVIAPSGENALTTLLGVDPTPLDKGLRQLAGVVPEQLPEEGVGPLVHKRYWADIDGSYHRAGALRDVFRRNFAQAMPFEVRAERGPLTNLKTGPDGLGHPAVARDRLAAHRGGHAAADRRRHRQGPPAGRPGDLQLPRARHAGALRGRGVRARRGHRGRRPARRDGRLPAGRELAVRRGARRPAERRPRAGRGPDPGHRGGRRGGAEDRGLGRRAGRAPDARAAFPRGLPSTGGGARAASRRWRLPRGRRRRRRKPKPRAAAAPRAKKPSRPGGPRRAAGTGSARRTRAGSGSARTTGRSARPAVARKARRKPR